MACMRPLPFHVPFALCLLLNAFVVGADETELSVNSVLEQRIIDPQLPLKEVQGFTDSHILPMPEATSVKDWEAYAARVREDMFAKVIFRGEAAAWKDLPTRVEWLETIDAAPEYSIRKLRYEAVPGMWVPALLYVPAGITGKVPVVMNVNGHDRPNGKAADYKQLRCINQVKRGMIALNIEWLGMGQLNTPGFNHYSMNQLDLCGTSGLAPFYLSMSRGLDILLELDHADPTRVAVAGLSGGGWQTIFISSLDPRVTLCNPVAGYSSFRTRSRYFSDLGDSEQTPCDMAMVTDYAQLTAMLAPRPALLTKNAEDNCCFKAEHALPPLLQAAKPVYDVYGKPENLRYHINHDPGTHNFGIDNRQQFYRMLTDFFGDPDVAKENAWTEIPSESELKSKEELIVDLPADNRDFNSVALQLSQDLPLSSPSSGNDTHDSMATQRDRLRSLIHAPHLDVLAIRQSQKSDKKLTASWWWLRMDGTWTVPAVDLTVSGTDPDKLAIVIADAGRDSVSEHVQRLLDSGHRVLAMDPFYFGESKIAERDFLFALLVSSIGERPLGIQSSQVIAACHWAREEFHVEQIRLVAVGPRTSLIALTSAALEPDRITQIEVHGCLESLRELITENKTVNQVPEMMCFGLLRHFDIARLRDMVGPRMVEKAAPAAP